MTAPHLKVIRGDAAPEDIAAILAVVAAIQKNVQPNQLTAIQPWSRRSALVPSFPAPGPGAWRASGLAQ